MGKIIDGKEVAKKYREKIKKQIQELKTKSGHTPGLAVILVGDDPASQTYVNSKVRICELVGINSYYYKLEADTKQEEILELINELNDSHEINGILVQLPLPKHLDEGEVINQIEPYKDVDGLHPYNVGSLWADFEDCLCPCTPAGIIELLDYYKIETQGKHVVIIGRSNLVGKPLAGLFLQKKRNATVTICHSCTENLAEMTKKADILVAAVGKPGLVKKEMIKKDAVVIDVGITRVDDKGSEKGYIISGDVDFEDVKPKSSWITPVPGGVGAMTTTMLMHNTLKAFKKYTAYL